MLNINPGLMIWTLITFAVAVFILWRYAFGPVQRIIDERRAQIRESMETAEETRLEAAKLLDEYKATLAKVREESEEILERSRKAGETTKAEILAEAKEQADRRLEKAREQMDRDTRAAIDEIKGQMADIALLAAARVAGKSLSKADHERLIDEALADVDFDTLSERTRG